LQIMIFASGGGHTAYAVAVGERLKEYIGGESIIFITPENDRWSVERITKRIPGSRVVEITKPLKPLEPYTLLLKRIMKAFRESLERINEEQGIMICTGSNHNLIPVLIGKFLRKHHIFCIEDVFRIKRRSRTVNIINRVAKAPVFLQWKIQEKLYRNGIYAGLVFEKPLYKPFNGGYILVTTGTIGNRELFKLLIKTRLDNLVIQSGAIKPEKIMVKNRYWKIFQFDPDIDKWIAGASLVIASPGITAINAVQAYGKPTIMVYNPDIVLGASFNEIKYVADNMGIPFIDPRKISPRDFEKLVEEPSDIKIIKHRDGAQYIARYIISFMKDTTYV